MVGWNLELCKTVEGYVRCIRLIANNHDMDTEELCSIAQIFNEHVEEGMNRVVYAAIIVDKLFNSDVNEAIINTVEDFIDDSLLMYDDDEYVDDVLGEMEVLGIDGDMLPLVLIANALLGKSLLCFENED